MDVLIIGNKLVDLMDHIEITSSRNRNRSPKFGHLNSTKYLGALTFLSCFFSRTSQSSFLVFVSNLKEAKKVEKLKPDYLIFEPPELVGGKISVSKAKPELIKSISKNIKMKFLVGAGIHSKNDVRKSLELGADGIAVSSAITKSKNPWKKLRELIL